MRHLRPRSMLRGFTRIDLLIALLLFSATLCQGAEPVWSVTEAVGAPSHAVYDQQRKTVFISQISGAGNVKDGVGTISRLDLHGRMLDSEWVAGLDAPKGMAIHEQNLWVSDIDRLHRIDLQTGAIRDTFDVPEAKFLCGVAASGDGVVFIADLLTSRIHQFQEGRFKVFASGNGLESPAGLVVKDNRLTVACWGLTTDFTTREPGRFLQIEGHTPRRISGPVGNLYGIVPDGTGGWIGTDFASGRVLHVSETSEPRVLLQLSPGAGGIEFIPGRELLIVPEITENRLSAYDLSQVLKVKPR